MPGKPIISQARRLMKATHNGYSACIVVNGRIKADKVTIIKSLEGNWCNEHLFLLRQSYTMYQFIQNQLCLCEQEVEKVLQLMAAEKQEGVIENIAPKSIHSTNPLKKRLKTSRYLIPGSI